MNLLIYGSQEFAATVAELAVHCGHRVAGMVDDFESGRGILGTLTEVTRSHSPADHGLAIAIGYTNLASRWKAYENVKKAGYRTPALVHPRSYVADSARVGEGAMVMAQAIVDVRADIGDLTVLWPGACINHDSRVGTNCFVSPNATVCGSVSIGPNCFIGAGAAVVDHCDVPESSFIKMLTRYTGRTP